MNPYRVPQPSEEVPLPPRDFVYETNNRDQNRNVHIAWVQLFGGPMLVGILVASFLGGVAGILGLAGTMAFGLWHRRHAPMREGAVLRVGPDGLHILTRNLGKEKAFFTLRELTDVEFDVKTIERLQDGNSAIPRAAFCKPNCCAAGRYRARRPRREERTSLRDDGVVSRAYGRGRKYRQNTWVSAQTWLAARVGADAQEA